MYVLSDRDILPVDRCISLVGAETPAAPTLPEFIEKLRPLAKNRTVQAEYRQTRHLQALNFTLEITGFMCQEQGQRLLWASLTPLHSRCIFSAESLRQWDAETGKVLSVSTSDMPWLNLIFTCQTQWLSGNLEALTENFSIVPLDSQTLKLTPKQAELRLFFSEVEIRFSRPYDAVERLVFKEKNGDSMQIDFYNVKTNAPIPEQLWILPPK